MPKLETILTHNGDHGERIELQHDRKNNLYKNGKKILIEKKIKLRWIELVIAITIAVSTAVQAITSVLPHI